MPRGALTPCMAGLSPAVPDEDPGKMAADFFSVIAGLIPFRRPSTFREVIA